MSQTFILSYGGRDNIIMEYQEIDSKELRIKNKHICNDSTTKEFANSDFWHYSTLHNVDLILLNQYFLVNNLSAMNDQNEIELHKKDCNNVHILSFCNSNTEKIPMWYLYSGISGEGAAIGFTPKIMMDFILGIDKIEVESTKKQLYKDIDFIIDYGWVFYKKDANNIKYKNKGYYLQDFDQFKIDNMFIKDYPWEYEKEFRIVIKTHEQCGKVKIPIQDTFLEKFKIKLAPELKKDRFKSLIHDLTGFHNWIANKTLYSDLDIKMGLIKRNVDATLDYLKNCNKTTLSEQTKRKINQLSLEYRISKEA